MQNALSKAFHSAVVTASFLTFITVIAVCSDYSGVVQVQLGANNKITIAGEKALPYLKDIR
jgi:hypothetical protein